MRSRLACLAVVLLVPVLYVGCGDEEYSRCVIECFFQHFHLDLCFFVCNPNTTIVDSEMSAEDIEYYQEQLSNYCEEHPEECQQAFDMWVEAFDEEAIE